MLHFRLHCNAPKVAHLSLSTSGHHALLGADFQSILQCTLQNYIHKIVANKAQTTVEPQTQGIYHPISSTLTKIGTIKMCDQKAQEVPEKDRKIPENKHPANQPDEYVRCPYFPEHELRRSRLPYHLMKCQKNPRAPNLVVCPFNYMHRVQMEDRQDHILLCEDRIAVKYADRIPPSYAKTREELLAFQRKTLEDSLRRRPNQFPDRPHEPHFGEQWWK